MAQLQTVNVLLLNVDDLDEEVSVVPERFAAFTEDEEGRKQAEALFLKWCKEADAENTAFSDEDWEETITDGYYTYYNGFNDKCAIIITHSTEPIKRPKFAKSKR